MRKTTIAAGIMAALSTTAIAGSKGAPANGATALRDSSSPARQQPAFAYPNRPTVSGSTVLYDQSGVATHGVPSQHFDATRDAYDAEASDDFVVSDAAGWAVSAFNFGIDATGDATNAKYDVVVHADDNGKPGAAVCSNMGLRGTLGRGGNGVSVSLTSPCALAKGTYWVELIVEAGAHDQIFWSGANLSDRGAKAKWQNARSGFATGCATWSDLAACGAAENAIGGGDTALLFQVIGAVGNGESCDAGGLCLTTSASTDTSPDACGGSGTLDATVGDQVNYCYVITNNTGVELDYHTLSDNLDGTIFTLLNQNVPDGGSFQFNKIRTVGTTETRTSTWAAQDVTPGYASEVTPGGGDCSDRILTDGFDGGSPPCPGSAFIDITGTGTVLGLFDDTMVQVAMPFSFNFYGATSNQACVGNNGFVLLTDDCGFNGLSANESLPGHSIPAPAILPLWDDFDSESGNVYTDTRGTAPNRQFIVEWFNRVHYNGSANTDGATFELILNEDGSIQFEYADVDYTGFSSSFPPDPDDCTGGLCATIGLQKDQTLFEQFSAFQNAVTNDSGIRWTALSPQVFTATDTVTVNVGSPELVIDPSPITGTVPAGGTSTIPFAVENHGNRDLNWSLTEAGPSKMHFPPPGTRFAMPMGDPSKTSSGLPPRALLQAAHPGIKPGAARHKGPIVLGDSVLGFVADVYLDSFYVIDVTHEADETPVGVALGTGFGFKFLDGDFSKAYGIDKFGTHVNTYGTVSTTNGMVHSIGTSIPTADPGGWTGFAEDPTSGTLYASAANCQTNSHLYTIDRDTGAASLIGEMTNMPCAIWIAIGPDGNMYSVDIVNDALYAVDKTSGETALIGPTGFNANYAQDADFDQSTGILYWAAFDNDALEDDIRTVNLTTGEASIVYSLGIPQIVGLAIETTGGPCTQQPQDLPWLSLSATSGTVPANGSEPINALIDATGTSAGDVLSGTLCANSNDPVHHRAATPVTVTVGSP